MNTQNLSILGYDAELTLVIEQGATEFSPIVMKNGNLYDPKCDFRPINPKPKQKSLTPDQQSRAIGLMQIAEKTWKPQEAKASSPAPEAMPEKPIELKTPQSTLDSLIARSVAEIAVSSVIDNARPALDKFIQDTYGILPKVVKIENGDDVKEVKGIVHEKFEMVLKLVAADIPVFLTGPAGCGKNVICKQIAEALNKEFYFSNAVTQEYKITGFIDANGTYQETQFFKAFTQGGVFMLDEMDASTPEVLVILNAAIANRYFDFPCGRYDAHPDFRIVAAGNTYGTGADMEYTGRFQLDASSLDRFALIEVTYDREIEKAIAGGDKELLAFIKDFREAIRKSDIKFTVSYRAIERLTKLKDMFDLPTAIQLAVLRGMSSDDAKLIANNLDNPFNKYTAELKKMLKK